MSLRRTASSMNSQGRAKHVSHRQSRISSPFHERLATHHTYATESKLLYKMPPSKIIPFYNVVRSAPTKPSFGAPPPTPRTCTSRHRTVPIPPAPRYASNNIVKDELISESGGRAHSGSTSTDSNPRLQEFRKVLKDKRDALYHRLSHQDTVSSSKMKPIPSDCHIMKRSKRLQRLLVDSKVKITKFMTVSSFV